MRAHHQLRRGWTLVELMVSATIAVIIVLAVSLVFNKAARTISDGRAAIELSGNLRAAAHQLREDLKGLTCPTLPIVDEGAGVGYFEYVEGPGRDWDADADGIADVLQPDADTTLGDIDDVLAFTARAPPSRPFRGYIQGDLVRHADGTSEYRVSSFVPNAQVPRHVIESQYAEIIWWTRWDDKDGNGRRDPGEVTLYRRHFLIRPDIRMLAGLDDHSSVVAGSSDRGRPLGELSRPGRRLLNLGVRFTALPTETPGVYPAISRLVLSRNGHLYIQGFENPADMPFIWGDETDQVTVLNNVLAFDVKAYDPMAPIKSSNARALVPGDPGYAAAPPSSIIGRGAYVDLNYAGDPTISWFSGPPDVRSGVWGAADVVGFTPGGPIILDTIDPAWTTYSMHKERNGLKEEMGHGIDPATAALPIDSGTNGIDDDGINGVDDAGEWETAPPYNHALRGIEITIRALEPDSHQVRQTTVRISFVPE
jgi:type II secretory pathway pseudopilin PulG